MPSPPRVTGAWTLDEIGGFLDEAVVPIRIACRTPSGPLWMVSLWYRWLDAGGVGAGDGADTGDAADAGDAADEGGAADTVDAADTGAVDVGVFHCATGADADVVDYLEHDDGVAFEVSTNDVPYRGVRGHGTVSIAPDEDKATLRALLERYLGGTDAALARRLLDDDRDEVRITVQPDRLFSWDFSDRMADVSPPSR